MLPENASRLRWICSGMPGYSGRDMLVPRNFREVISSKLHFQGLSRRHSLSSLCPGFFEQRDYPGKGNPVRQGKGSQIGRGRVVHADPGPDQ